MTNSATDTETGRTVSVLRSAAFGLTPEGGNPAGVVVVADDLNPADMQHVAAEVDYAETAFVTGATDSQPSIRFFSPIAEVPFCGHATIATAVALVEQCVHSAGEHVFRTSVGPIAIRTRVENGVVHAAFTSVDPSWEPMPAATLSTLAALIGIEEHDLDDRMPPALVFAGNVHPVIVIAEREVFDSFTFDPKLARRIMDAHGWPATVTILHGTAPTGFTARNIFPVGRITEDPATGSAAAAIGAYVRAFALASLPAIVIVQQGAHVGRPSELVVDVPETGGITVSGSAIEIDTIQIVLSS